MAKTRTPSPRSATARRTSSGKPRPGNAAAPPAEGLSPHRWTFLTNHAHVLVLLSRDPSLVLRTVAQQVGITERAVQRIIADLQEDGYLERTRVGRRNQYRIRPAQPLRHPIEAHRTIGDLLRLVDARG